MRLETIGQTSETTPVIELPPTAVVPAAHTLAASFMADPFFCYLVPDKAQRSNWLFALMRANLLALLPDRQVFAEWRDDRVAAAIGLLPPGGYPLPFWRNAKLVSRMMVPSLRVNRRFAMMRRALATLRWVEDHHLHPPHWYVFVIGVDPQRQGRGLGRRLLEPSLARADGEGLPVYLETANPVNLGFYRRFGFDVVDELTSDQGGPPLWTMLRPSEQPGSDPSAGHYLGESS